MRMRRCEVAETRMRRCGCRDVDSEMRIRMLMWVLGCGDSDVEMWMRADAEKGMLRCGCGCDGCGDAEAAVDAEMQRCGGADAEVRIRRWRSGVPYRVLARRGAAQCLEGRGRVPIRVTVTIDRERLNSLVTTRDWSIRLHLADPTECL
jgi:hypothetical protein